MNTYRSKLRINLRWLLLGVTALILMALQLAGMYGLSTPLDGLDYSGRDLMMRLRGTRGPSGDIVIVAIDDFSFQWNELQWPWPRAYLAGIVDQINEGGARVVGIDVQLFENSADKGGDEALAAALGRSRASVTVMQIFSDPAKMDAQTLILPLGVYRDQLDGLGTTSIMLDPDAVARSLTAFESYGDHVYYNWAFELARLYAQSDQASDPAAVSLQFQSGPVPLKNGRLLVNFNGPPGTYPIYSAADVHDGVTLEQDPDAFRDKIVLIGATSITLQDVYPTPFSTQERMPGVEVVANAVDTLLRRDFLREPLPWVSLLITLGAAAAAALITRWKRPTRIVVTLGVGMLLYAAAAFLAFALGGWLLPLTAPESMLFLGVILPTLEQAVSQEMEKRRVRSLFTRFISPEMVDQLISTQDINSLNKRTHLTILFSDIRGFTTMSEKLAPEEVVALLNSYLESMTNIVHKHGGTVDKYEGDAVVAFFGEPVPYADHAVRAVRAAAEMLWELPGLTEKWIAEGRPISRFDIGIGLNSGDVFVGLIGSAQRINYTVIGDNANLASRIQDLTKKYQWPLLISESTYLQSRHEFQAELVDSVVVKGRSEPVKLYRVLGRGEEKVQPWKAAEEAASAGSVLEVQDNNAG